MLAILHITDLHFGKQAEEIFTDKQDLANSIAAAVARAGVSSHFRHSPVQATAKEKAKC